MFKDDLEAIARCLYPAILAHYNSTKENEKMYKQNDFITANGKHYIHYHGGIMIDLEKREQQSPKLEVYTTLEGDKVLEICNELLGGVTDINALQVGDYIFFNVNHLYFRGFVIRIDGSQIDTTGDEMNITHSFDLDSKYVSILSVVTAERVIEALTSI